MKTLNGILFLVVIFLCVVLGSVILFDSNEIPEGAVLVTLTDSNGISKDAVVGFAGSFLGAALTVAGSIWIADTKIQEENTSKKKKCRKNRREKNWSFKDYCSENWAIILIIFAAVLLTVVNIITARCFSVKGKTGVLISDLGSFLGGLLGGLATLIAVVKTIKNEETVRVRKSATIVYYDFKFTFDVLLKCKAPNIAPKIEEVKNNLNQFYFDSDWIKTVAELNDDLDASEIQSIYQIYGDFQTIQKFIESDTQKAREAFKAQKALNDIMRTSGLNEISKIEDIKIMNRLSEIMKKSV